MHWVFSCYSPNNGSFSKSSATTSTNKTTHIEHFEVVSSSSGESKKCILKSQNTEHMSVASSCSSSSAVGRGGGPVSMKSSISSSSAAGSSSAVDGIPATVVRSSSSTVDCVPSSSAVDGSFSALTKLIHPIPEIDTKENDSNSLNLLIDCAKSVQENHLNDAKTILSQIWFNNQAGGRLNITSLLAKAISSKIHGLDPPHSSSTYLDLIRRHFYQVWSYVEAAHLTANRAVLKAFAGKKHVHIIDLSVDHGMQWPDLMRDLAARPGGPPTLRISGIGIGSSDYHGTVSQQLTELAETLHIDFEYRGFLILPHNLADLDAAIFRLRADEAVAVNSVFELHKLLATPGDIDKVLSMIKQIKPVIFTLVEQESNNNDQPFFYRFTECLNYFSSLLDSLQQTSTDYQYTPFLQKYLGNQISNILACEGEYRVERFETLRQWRTRLVRADFVPVHLGSNMAEYTVFLLSQSAGGKWSVCSNCTIDNDNGCWILGWRARPLVAISSWQVGNWSSLPSLSHR